MAQDAAAPRRMPLWEPYLTTLFQERSRPILWKQRRGRLRWRDRSSGADFLQRVLMLPRGRNGAHFEHTFAWPDAAPGRAAARSGRGTLRAARARPSRSCRRASGRWKRFLGVVKPGRRVHFHRSLRVSMIIVSGQPVRSSRTSALDAAHCAGLAGPDRTHPSQRGPGRHRHRPSNSVRNCSFYPGPAPR